MGGKNPSRVVFGELSAGHLSGQQITVVRKLIG